jgi:hypothetical protein
MRRGLSSSSVRGVVGKRLFVAAIPLDILQATGGTFFLPGSRLSAASNSRPGNALARSHITYSISRWLNDASNTLLSCCIPKALLSHAVNRGDTPLGVQAKALMKVLLGKHRLRYPSFAQFFSPMHR